MKDVLEEAMKKLTDGPDHLLLPGEAEPMSIGRAALALGMNPGELLMRAQVSHVLIRDDGYCLGSPVSTVVPAYLMYPQRWIALWIRGLPSPLVLDRAVSESTPVVSAQRILERMDPSPEVTLRYGLFPQSEKTTRCWAVMLNWTEAKQTLKVYAGTWIDGIVTAMKVLIVKGLVDGVVEGGGN